MNRKLVLVVAIIVLMALFCVCLVGCNESTTRQPNREVFNVNHISHAYVNVGGEWISVEVEKWSDFGDNVNIYLKDGSVIVTSFENCILYNGNLPKGE